jgi:cold shock CspA family protein
VLKILGVEERTTKKAAIEGPAKVKFFSMERGYGIFVFEDGNEAFVHKKFLREIGVDPLSLQRDRRFRVKACIGSKGLRVVELSALGGRTR